ncbi:serine hydrolase [bacterium]|nr:serine hydrolase [bacterium]
MKRLSGISVLCIALFSLLAAGGMSLSHAASNALSYKPFPPEWQAEMDHLVAEDIIPGGVIVIKSPAWGVRVGVAGKANIAENVPMSPDHQFRVGSVTKSFTALTLLQMEQEGLIQLDDTVDMYLTGEQAVQHNAHLITIEDLLQMESGLEDYLAAPEIQTMMNQDPLHHYSPMDLLGFVNELNPLFAPGDTYPNPYQVMLWGLSEDQAGRLPYWYYSNSNYHLIGMIIENISGRTLAEEMKTRIMDPLGMQDSYLAEETSVPEGFMRGYVKADKLYNPTQQLDEWRDVTETNPSYAWAAGAVISTPWDLLRYLESQFEEEIIINKWTQKKRLNFVSADIKWMDVEYGIGGVMQSQRPYGDCRGHGGAYPGFKTLIYYFHDDKTSFVLSINTWDGHAEVELLDAIMPMVLDQHAMAPTPRNLTAEAPFTQQGGVNLKWQAGTIYGDPYRVYIGTNETDVDFANEASSDVKQVVVEEGTSTEVMELADNTTYYWRVDTITEEKTFPGPVWSFTTGEKANASINQWDEFESQ